MKFAVGDYIDKVDCDVVPMDACQLLLGRPWQFDHDAVHAGRSNTYMYMHRGRKHVLKPMADSAITTEMQIPERKVVQKLDPKPRTVSFKGRKDDTAMKPLIVDVTDAEPVKESNHEKVVKNNAMHAARFH